MPDASLAIVLSGTGSRREYVQRLGRILRRREGKQAVLYEVVAEATSEEQVSRRRRQDTRVSAARHIDGRAPDLFADDEGEAPVAQHPHPGQEDDRSYPPSC
jgi:superfamily II DNA or RNA helicase